MYQKIHDFRKKYYTSDRINICIRSVKSLDDLQAMALKYIPLIPKNEKIQPPLSDMPEFSYKFALKEDFYKEVIYAKPAGNEKTMFLSYMLPPVMLNYKSKPIELLKHLFEWNGEGSLRAYLKKKWAKSWFQGKFF